MGSSSITPVIDRWLAQRVHRGDSPGLAASIVEGSETILFSAHGYSDIEKQTEFTVDTRVPVASLMKPMVAAAAVRLVADHQLRLDVPIDQYVDREMGVSLIDLLTHTAGFAIHGDGHIDLDYQYRPGTSAGAPRTPGKRLVYSNYGYSVAAEVLEHATGKSLDELFAEYFFEPLGMTNSGIDKEPNAEGYLFRTEAGIRPRFAGNPRSYGLHGAGDLVSTAADIGKFLQLWTEGDDLDGMLRTHWFQADASTRWGLGWELSTIGSRNVGLHGGQLPGFHHGMFVDLDNRRAGVIVSNAIDSDAEAWSYATATAFDLAGDDFTPSPAMQRMTGVFSTVWGDDAIVPIGTDSMATIHLDSSEPFTDIELLEPVSETELLITSGSVWSPLDEKVVFTFDEEDNPETVFYGSDQVRFIGRL